MSTPSTILIVDDLPHFRDIFSIALANAGYRTVTANNGKEGVEKAKSEKPDLILLDVDMPVMDGVDAIAALKADPESKDIKVIFLTSFGDPAGGGMDAKYAKELGAYDFLPKSTTLPLIVDFVKKALD